MNPGLYSEPEAYVVKQSGLGFLRLSDAVRLPQAI